MFKIVIALRGHQRATFAYIIPNNEQISEPLENFATTVAEVERQTGLHFALH